MTEETKRCVEALRICHSNEDCRDCKFIDSDKDEMSCVNILFVKAAYLIESLSAQLEQVTRERDAAVEAAHGVCKACIHFNGHYPTGDIMSCCKFEECVYGMDEWDAEDHWQWRGVEVEG